MQNAIQFIADNWVLISGLIAAIAARLIPTEKNYDVFKKILSLLDMIIPNLKKGGGRHIAKALLFFALVSVSANSFAQLNTRVRQIRFATGVQKSADTTANADNAGRIWYDFVTGRYRANEGGTNKFLVGGSANSNYWKNSGTTTLSSSDVFVNSTLGAFQSNVTEQTIGIRANDGQFAEVSASDNSADGYYSGLYTTKNSSSHTGTTAIVSPISNLNFNWTGGINAGTYTGSVTFTDARASTSGIEYAGDYSSGFTDRSLIDKAYADTKIDGTMAVNLIPYGVDANTLTRNDDFSMNTAGAGNYNVQIDGIRLGKTYIDQGNTAIITGITNDLTTPNQGLSIYNVQGKAGNVTPGNMTIYGGQAYNVGNNPGGSVIIASGDGNGTGAKGNVYIGAGSITTGTQGGWIVLKNLPTATPCGTAPSGTLWSNAGVLTVCP